MGPLHIQCSTSKQLTSRLGLNLFRGEPAISEFDWNFSANHKSSAHVSGYVGSVPIQFYLNFNLLMARSLGFGSIASYYVALFRLGFPSAPSFQLNLA